jgi:2,4-dienoyl-CoA reductase (NADPH2)
VLCNQGCQVRDVRNPIVTCALNPTAGHELEESHLDDERPKRDLATRTVHIVGAGPAGLEAARRAALRGAKVTIKERRDRVGGALLDAARLPGRAKWLDALAWYEAELARLGVRVVTGEEVPNGDPDVDLAAIGRSLGEFTLRDGNDGSVSVVSAAAIVGEPVSATSVVVIDPVGGPIGVGICEQLARDGAAVALVTPDLVAGTQLSLTGDLVGANARLANVGVELVTHAQVVAISSGAVVIEDRYDGEQWRRECALVVNAGFDLPSPARFNAPAIGDALAPRSVTQAILEARRYVAALVAGV